MSNYRPISLLDIPSSKIFKKCVFDELYEFVRPLIPARQFGFQKRKLIILQLICYLDEIFNAVDDPDKTVSAVYLDFAKAFDKVSHSELLSKLHRIGIGGNLFRVIKSYLTNRKQNVQLGSVKSSLLEITSGVPQGSLLGPLLFFIYVKDLPDGISTLPYMFADDSKLLDILKRNAYSPAQEDLQILERWCTANSMEFNASKCHIMTFGANSQSPALKLNNIYLEQSRSEKDLGITVSDTLKWTSHVQKVCDKANKVFHMVKRKVSRLLPYQQKLHLYKSGFTDLVLR